MWTHQPDRSQQYLSGNAEAANWREIRNGSGLVVRTGSVTRNGDEYSGVWMREDDAELICTAVNACRAINPDNPLAAANALSDAIRLLRRMAAFANARCKREHSIDNPCDGLCYATEEALAALKGGAQ